ncbi:hypothetical protein KIPB_015261 [Kipferlia bialata]|uniref:Uncharacterized protein n=1 Tax=Kipferlia bialata TaxID=797122 RepID=A0A391NUL6_9EUKA|nr:hypothetical protein KIPB_015261 [Kipferlia bialata]|eukprot:g15261.t1
MSLSPTLPSTVAERRQHTATSVTELLYSCGSKNIKRGHCDKHKKGCRHSPFSLRESLTRHPPVPSTLCPHRGCIAT